MSSIRKLGVALVAAFALSAMAAIPAAAGTFHASAEPWVTTVNNTGEGHITYSTGSGNWTCTGGTGSGTSPTRTTTGLWMHPTLTGCTFLGGNAPVEVEGCDFEMGAGGIVKLVCSGTNTMKVTGPGCTLSYGSQTTEGGANYKNLNSNKEITITINTKMTFSKSGVLCGAVSGTSGTLTASFVSKAYEDLGGTGHTYTEGSQISVWWTP